tara:strand:- start:700 stop:1122 length:423 start_codon:yes stop_codon:yes gene_type:complete
MELRFSPRGLEVLSLAGFRAERPESRQICTEDLLAALLEAGGVPQSVLRVIFGVEPRLIALRQPSADPLEFTREALRALEFAVEEHTRLGRLPGMDPGITPAHLMLGLCRTKSGQRSLGWLGLSPQEVRLEVLEVLAYMP